MKDSILLQYISDLLSHLPTDWLRLTTHRLDIYDESRAKSQFVEELEKLYSASNSESAALSMLPTAYDYIRLGHPLSSVLEWAVARLNGLAPESVISFSSQTMPILALLRKNLLEKKDTHILYRDSLPESFDPVALKDVYGYSFEIKQVEALSEVPPFTGSTIFVCQNSDLSAVELSSDIDFVVCLEDRLGSILLVNGEENKSYISEIQHVRRRETIAMTPASCFAALHRLVGTSAPNATSTDRATNQSNVLRTIQEVTGSKTEALLASSGLSIQYAITMGLIDHALSEYPDKKIKLIVPPNCYGGTNDQARRIAACLHNVEVEDLLVDDGHDMVQSIEIILDQVAKEDGIPFIIAEIPTNPRVEVPDLNALQRALSIPRTTKTGESAIEPVFILDQTFCPNAFFLREEDLLASVATISYVSGSKFPSGGKCTAGYCAANDKAARFMEKIQKHLVLCNNEATDLQVELLAEQMPSMNRRIQEAYENTRKFVSFIQEVLPTAKINFVSEELAGIGFTPSVFSLDLPTKGGTEEEREQYKRALNLKLINLMIAEIPEESKYCVSYGQLKGCYWTIPATSTQGTTKEGDKDYIVRTSVSPNFNLERHKEVFLHFVNEIV